MMSMSNVSPILPLDDFLHHRPQGLRSLFQSIIPHREWHPFNGWSVINPRGDGNCLLYAVASVCIEYPKQNMSVVDEMMFHFIDGVKKYINITGQSFCIDGDDNEWFTIDHNTPDEEILFIYTQLVNKNTISMRILNAFKYAFNTNIVFIAYDEQSVQPFYRPSIFEVDNKITYIDGHMLEDEPRVVYILSTSGHNFGMIIHSDFSKEAFARFKQM